MSRNPAFNDYPKHSGQSDQKCYLFPGVSPNPTIIGMVSFICTRIVLDQSLTIEIMQWLVSTKISISEGEKTRLLSSLISHLHKQLKHCYDPYIVSELVST